MEDYNTTIELNAKASQVFVALTQKVPLWWTEMFEGSAAQQNDVFTVRFGDNVFKTMEVTEVIDQRKVVWLVKQSLIAIPELKNQTEWVGTSIIWQIKQSNTTTQLQLEHKGLNANVECYQICANGWQQFTNSLKSYIETGKANPYKNLS
ncbi:SRPBCC family protein [Pedobacter helvus]|uniref:SRPBCC family protein n=1 Tax=Pedobacter helvus TaxID=2563444 RepID=A0ABW9JD26_9SPHI|nr:SRPBCC domain-containing protein [Pedobacter ureilyticus]